VRIEISKRRQGAIDPGLSLEIIGMPSRVDACICQCRDCWSDFRGTGVVDGRWSLDGLFEDMKEDGACC